MSERYSVQHKKMSTTMAKDFEDMRQIVMLTKVIEFERLRNHNSVLIGALNQATSHVEKMKGLNVRKFLHGFLLVLHRVHGVRQIKSTTNGQEEDFEKKHVFMEIKLEDMSTHDEKNWLTNFNNQMVSVDSAKKVPIHINYGGILTISVDLEQSCRSLNKLIENKLGCDMGNLSLRLGSKLLDNQISLKSCGVVQNSVLYLHPKLCGGCQRQSVHDYINSGVQLIDNITIPDPDLEGQKLTVENLSLYGRRLAKSIIDVFIKAHCQNKTWDGKLNLSDFTVYNGRVEVTRQPRSSFLDFEWQNDCKKLAQMLRHIFTAKPLYMSDLIQTLENVDRSQKLMEWLRIYIEYHLALAPSFNKSNVSDKIVQIYESMDRTMQKTMKDAVNAIRLGDWKNSRIQNKQIFTESLKYHKNKYGKNYEFTSFGGFRFLRNFTTHASEEKASNGAARFAWWTLEYVIAFVFGNFVPQVIKSSLEKGVDLKSLLQSATPM